MSEATADVLGVPFVAEVIELPDDSEGTVVATLVHSPAPSRSGRAVLYVHGFCDYFFQRGLAEFCTSLGYDFYALDLRKYGRSLLPHQTPNFCLDLDEYNDELDEALRRITERDGHTDVVAIAHSTGGLVVPLWADQRRLRGLPGPSAFVLNSPWFDLQGSFLLRTVGTRALDTVGARRPYQVIPRNVSAVYGESIHRAHRGEWDFDTAWKPMESFPVRAGWLRAVRRGHRKLHRGIEAGAPVLVLASRRTLFTAVWSQDVPSADVVLDVEQMARWSHRLGSLVTIARFDGAVHDVFLSAQPVRDQVYATVRRFLAALDLD
ncbi:MAG: alpha/beta hydrolase [Nocardioidaceae bacterium]|nr:alpha/beta hydrolase [Nocardioidaceae bacterium]